MWVAVTSHSFGQNERSVTDVGTWAAAQGWMCRRQATGDGTGDPQKHTAQCSQLKKGTDKEMQTGVGQGWLGG